MNIGKKIREIRTIEKISQKKLAEMLKINQRRVSYWETGKRKITAESLLKIANIFNKDINFFNTGEENEQVNTGQANTIHQN